MNSFFGLGPMELFLIVFIALIVLGPQRLPGAIREVMKYWRYFRNLSSELTSQLGEEFKDLEDLNPQKMLEGFANELDDEIERTQDAAGIKKTKKTTKTTTSSAKKSTATKSSTTKTSTPKSSTTKTSTSTAKTSSTEKAADSANADVEPLKRGESLVDETAAVAGGAAATAGASKAGASDASSNGSGESHADSAPMKAEVSDQPLADLENSIMPPASKDASNNDGKSVGNSGPASTSEQVATDTKSTASAAKSSVNGAANKSEDEG